MKKFLFGLAPVLAMAALASAPATALARHHHKDPPCRVLASFTTGAAPAAGKCVAPPGVVKGGVEAQNLRDNGDGNITTPVSTNFPTNGLLVNTLSEVRFVATISKVAVASKLAQGYGFFGVDLYANPENSTTICRSATGAVPWIDLQNTTIFNSTNVSAVFDSFSPWTFTINSDSSACASPGKVTIRNVSLLFEQLGAGKGPVVASGTFVGTYSAPTAKCPGGGIEIEPTQTGITTEPASEKVEVNNGVANTAALFCFVSANNYLFPKTAPSWAELTNINAETPEGIWKTKEP